MGEFARGFHFVYPADHGKSSPCRGGAVAYVWRSGQQATSYQVNRGPCCNSGVDATRQNCGIDQYGKYYVYLCSVFMSQSEQYQTGVLVHEAAHHAGPNDVTGNLGQMKSTSQQNQLMNAANYENFAKTVVNGGCDDEDGNCGSYKPYCNQQNIKDQCKRTCGLCAAVPRPRPVPPPATPRRRQPQQGCADLDGNCRYYTEYCNTENIKNQCRKTCGLCSGGSPRPTPRRRQPQQGCKDLDGNCRYYTQYCNTDNIKDQCRKTCGLCSGG